MSTHVDGLIFLTDDPGATNALCERYRPHLTRLAERLTGEPDAAADLVQDTLLRAWERRHTYRGGALLVWMEKIMRRLHLTRCRLEKRRLRHESDVPVDVLLFREESPEPDPFQLLLSAENDDRLAAAGRALSVAIRRLPPRQRQVVQMRALADLTVNETATLLGCAPGTVKAHFSTAVKRLNAELRAFRPDA